MTPIPYRRSTSQYDLHRRPTRPEMSAVRSPSGVVPRDVTRDESHDDRDIPRDETRRSGLSSDSTPTPLLPPPPGPQPARHEIPPDDLPVVVPEDLPLDLLLRSVPRVVRSRDELDDAPIEHRDCYILALLDGETSVKGLVDIAGMEPDDVLRILQRLRRLSLIRMT